MLGGLFEKVVLADQILAPVCDRIYGAAATAGTMEAWVGTLAFAGQIFCDFAGYSTCGIGAALCLGFALNDNFHYPYGAVGFSDFWRRWHISLSSWLRDYLYIPLGGNRGGTGATVRNLMLTMLLGGLWHGASWRFVAWGGLHGTYLIAERALQAPLARLTDSGRMALRPLGAALTFLGVCVAWVFFRASSFDEALGLLDAMFSWAPGAPLEREDVAAAAVVAAMLAFHWRLRDVHLEALVDGLRPQSRALLVAAMVAALLFVSGEERVFIYFQF